MADPFETILPMTASITVKSPNGGENWQRGTTHNITWSSSGMTAGELVKVHLFKAGKWVSTIFGTPNDGVQAWAIPSTLATGTDYSVRVERYTDSKLGDFSNANFTISAPAATSITVTSPNGGENWQRGTTQNIKWNKSGNVGTNVKIELLKGTVVNKVILASTPNDGVQAWAIPSTQTTGADYKIRITSTSNTAIKDVSNAAFTISAPAATTPKPTDYTFLYMILAIVVVLYLGKRLLGKKK